MFSEKLRQYKDEILTTYQKQFQHLDAISEENTLKVLDAMRECKVSDAHFNTTTG